MNVDLSTLDFNHWLLIFVGLTLILLTISLLVRRRSGVRDTISTPGQFFLVLLRLAIGWHCLFEGLDKIHNPGWTSEAYLREAYGPAGAFYRNLAGDTLTDRLTVSAEGQLPPRLDAEWQAYFDAFASHYGLDDEQRQKAQASLDQSKADTASWFNRPEEVTKIAPQPPELKVPMTMAQRLEEMGRLEAKVAEAEANLPSTDPDLQKRWKDAKADLARWRAGLKKSLDAQTAKMKEKLPDVLTSDQKLLPTLREPVSLPLGSRGQLEWSDFLVSRGLVILGALLIVGLFSRLASAALAVLLFSFYLAMPPLPGWPDLPRQEGHYFIVNKTLIEVLALAALACIPTGRWLGVDALVALIFGRKRTVPVETRRT